MGIGTMDSTSYIRPPLRLRATGFDTILGDPKRIA
jgi:hypothetical protein